MFDLIKSKARRLVLCAAFASLALGLAACSPSESVGTTPVTNMVNDTAVKGTLEAYDPAVDAETHGGKAIEGSEEEQLQQERIAGGAVGAVVSKNLEPLAGITGYSKGDYVDSYGIYDQPPVLGKDNTRMPPSHTSAKLKGTDCVTCHTEQ